MLPGQNITGRQVGAGLVEILAPWAAGAALDAMLNVGLNWINQQPDTPVADQTSAMLASGLTIELHMGDMVQNNQASSGVIAELSSRADGDSAIRNAIGDPPFAAPATTDLPLAQASDNDLALLRRAMERSRQAPDGLSEPAKANLRKATRKRTDGKRVSMERHEYVYCRDSGQIDRVFELSEFERDGNHTYGRFVDSPLMRKAIELVRRFQRQSRQAGTKFVLDALNLNDEQLFNILREGNDDFFNAMQAGAEQYNQNA